MSTEWNYYKEKLDSEFYNIKNRFLDKLNQMHATRLHPDLIANISVNSYGEETSLKSVANIQLTTARSFTIKPYDASLCDAIEKAIRKSKPDFNPINSSGCVTLSFPPTTEESRKKSVKQLKVIEEETNISIRKLRHDVQKEIKGNELPKDLEKKFMSNLDQQCKKYTDESSTITKNKEKELLTV